MTTDSTELEEMMAKYVAPCQIPIPTEIVSDFIGTVKEMRQEWAGEDNCVFRANERALQTLLFFHADELLALAAGFHRAPAVIECPACNGKGGCLSGQPSPDYDGAAEVDLCQVCSATGTIDAERFAEFWQAHVQTSNQLHALRSAPQSPQSPSPGGSAGVEGMLRDALRLLDGWYTLQCEDKIRLSDADYKLVTATAEILSGLYAGSSLLPAAAPADSSAITRSIVAAENALVIADHAEACGIVSTPAYEQAVRRVREIRECDSPVPALLAEVERLRAAAPAGVTEAMIRAIANGIRLSLANQPRQPHLAGEPSGNVDIAFTTSRDTAEQFLAAAGGKAK